MKKAICFGFFATALSFLNLLGHSSGMVHLHPHGENAFPVTWATIIVIGLVLGGGFLWRRARQ